MTKTVDEKSLEAEIARLDGAGNESRNLGFLGRLVRKIAWRLLRPYHIHSLRLLAELEDKNRRLDQALADAQKSADGLQWQIDHLKIAQTQGQAAAEGLQWQIGDINGRLEGVNHHLDETRGLYGHLADEMPKFVAPILDLKRELADVDGRAQQLSDDVDAARLEARAVGLRIAGIEETLGGADDIDGLKANIAQLHERIDGVNHHLDETRGLYGHLADEMPKFVAPIIDLKAELANLENLSQQLAEDLTAVRQEGQVVAQRLNGMENDGSVAAEHETARVAVMAEIAALHTRIDHLDAHVEETSGLFGNLADEMPKAIAPIVDFKTDLLALEAELAAARQESAATLNRIDALEGNTQVSEETEALKAGLAQANARLDGVNNHLDETRTIIAAVAAERPKREELEAVRTEIVQFQQDISNIDADIAEMRGTVRALSSEVPRVAEPLAALQAKAAEVDSLGKRIIELETIVTPLSNSEKVPLSQRLLELSDKISEIEARLREVSQRQASSPEHEDSASALALAQVDDLKTRLVELSGAVSSIRAGSEEYAGQIEAVNQASRAATALAESAAEKAQAMGQGSNLFMANTDEGIFLFQSGDLIAKIVAETGQWDAHIVALMNDLIGTRAGVAIDVGAHVGTMTIPMARRFEQVHSFEPNDFTFKILSANVALNNVKNVTLHNYPLFSKTTKLSLATEDTQEGPVPFDNRGHYIPQDKVNLGGLSFAEKGLDVFAHTARTLDSLKLTNVDLIKIDAQGADGEVLLGALETINACRPVVVFEWEEHLSKNYNCDLDKIRANLARIGYSLGTLFRHNDKQSDYVAYSLK